MNRHATNFTPTLPPPSRGRNPIVIGIDASQANREIRSGTEWYAFYLIQEFKKLLRGREDVKVRLYFRDSPRADLLNEWPDNWEVKILKWPLRYFWGQIRLSWEMLVNSLDVLFCPAHTIPLIHPGSDISLNPSPRQGRGGRGGGRTFTTLHDIGFVDSPELYDKLSLWYHRFSAWLAVRSAHHIFTISEFSRRRIVEHYKCPENKISVTYLGMFSDFSAEKPENRGETDGRKFILFIGRMEPKKNVLGMVKAYEVASASTPRNDNSFPDLILAGRKVRVADVEDYLAKRPALRDKVKFLGYIDEERKRELLQRAVLFLFPTFYEGFGLPILEAQATGVPVITSNTTSNPEVAGSSPMYGPINRQATNAAILVDPKNIEEIAAAIHELLTNQELRNQKIKQGYENVKRFSWEKTAKETLARLLET